MLRLLPSPDRLLLAPLTVFALVALLLGGCATSRPPASSDYRQARNEMVYRARAINLGTLFESGGLGADPRVSLRGWATCEGENCRPNEVWLSFSLRRTGKEMQIVSDRSVTIETGKDTYSWRQSNVGNSSAPTSGALVRVSLRRSAFKDVATTQQFSGAIGGEEFSLSYEEREPLRALIERMENPSKPVASASS